MSVDISVSLGLSIEVITEPIIIRLSAVNEMKRSRLENYEEDNVN